MRRSEGAPPLTYEQTAQMLARLAHIEHEMVLVGGQSVNFWAEYYLDRVPALAAEAPYTSKDIDFCSDQAAVEECARRLGGRARIATLDDMGTPNIGTVTFVDDEGYERTIDFLTQPLWLAYREVVDTSLPASILACSGDGVMATFRVMHPILVLESRTANVANLPNHDTDLGRKQLHAAILCAREYVKDCIARGESRIALNAANRVLQISESDDRLRVYLRHRIEPLDAIPRVGLVAKFYERHLPRVAQRIDRKRSRLALSGDNA